MTPSLFWRISPKKLSALCKVHTDLNSAKQENKPGKKSKQTKSKGVGAPDTFDDQLY